MFLKCIIPFLFLFALSTESYKTVRRGRINSKKFKLYFKDEHGGYVSPLHDIPLFANEQGKIYNMVVEIPRWTNAKMEISLKDPLNPIKQDVKNGKLRYVSNCFPHHGYIWNYGAVPQTWENPQVLDKHTGHKGDADPIDIMEIGYRIAKRGEVLQVKVVGVIALIDEGETDWKLFAIDVKDPLADKINDIPDIDKYFPGLMKATIEWCKIYKIPDGKPENQFAFNGEAKSAVFAHDIIQEVHHHWKSLIAKEIEYPSISCANVRVSKSPYVITNSAAEEIVNKSPPPQPGKLPIPPIIDKWHFITLNLNKL